MSGVAGWQLPWLLLPVVAVRPVHWGIRASSLERTLDFAQNVLGMQVLLPSMVGCSTGDKVDSFWSKTVLGYGADSLALEVAYNDAVPKFPRGEGLPGGLQRLVLELTNLQGSILAAKRLGYGVENGTNGTNISVVGPDGYVFELRSASSPKRVGLQSVVLHAENLELVAAWYEELFGLTRGAHTDVAAGAIGLQLRNRSVQFIFEAIRAPALITGWDGRLTLAMPERQLSGIYAWLSQESPLSIIQPSEKLPGSPLQALLRDPAGYELCLVADLDMAATPATSHARTSETQSSSPSGSPVSLTQRLEL